MGIRRINGWMPLALAGIIISLSIVKMKWRDHKISARAECASRIIKVVVPAIESYYKRTGKYPKQIQGLPNQHCICPASGLVYRYELSENLDSCKVYCGGDFHVGFGAGRNCPMWSSKNGYSDFEQPEGSSQQQNAMADRRL